MIVLKLLLVVIIHVYVFANFMLANWVIRWKQNNFVYGLL